MKSTLALVVVLGLAACGGLQKVSRGAELPGLRAHSGGQTAGLQTSGGADKVLVPVAYDVTAIIVAVPHTLRVSEANSLVPIADIVWHGDPMGDRYLQVQTLLTEAAEAGTKAMTTGQKVTVEIEVTRFHALTPKARYTFGGNFATHFLLTVRDFATGDVVDGPRRVVADVHASGGARAIEEEAAGVTEKLVIEDHLAKVIAHELSQRLMTKGQAVALTNARESPPPTNPAL
ncbi:MAG: DUF6778 family protein [Cypionkella sp.]